MEHAIATVASPVGRWGVEGTDRVITRVWMPSEHPRATRGATLAAVADGARQLAEYFNGRRRTFAVTLDDAPSTDFQRDVWRALTAIAYGETRTYGDVALEVGRPLAARAVGQANHANPWAIIVPCHRVVAAAGLGGYGGGLEVKAYLLDLERASRRATEPPRLA